MYIRIQYIRIHTYVATMTTYKDTDKHGCTFPAQKLLTSAICKTPNRQGVAVWNYMANSHVTTGVCTNFNIPYFKI